MGIVSAFHMNGSAMSFCKQRLQSQLPHSIRGGIASRSVIAISHQSELLDRRAERRVSGQRSIR